MNVLQFTYHNRAVPCLNIFNEYFCPAVLHSALFVKYRCPISVHCQGTHTVTEHIVVKPAKTNTVANYNLSL